MSAARKGKLKERHHWWPECLSKAWCEPDGLINVLASDGRAFRSAPANVGVIGNAHIIKLRRGEPSPWDESFEHTFNAADSALPRVVAWLEGLEREWIDNPPRRAERFHPQPIGDAQFADLVEGLVSLVVRSPRFRAAAVAPAIHLRGSLEADERHLLEAMNMRHCQRMIADSCRTSGKLVVLYAREGEFIFGDGFFNTATAVSGPPMSPKILAPLTPEISVLYVRPVAFRVEPRLTTLVLDGDEVEALNTTVQVYAKDWLFYRSNKPTICEDFSARQHRVFSDGRNPVDEMIRHIPGVMTSAPFH